MNHQSHTDIQKLLKRLNILLTILIVLVLALGIYFIFIAKENVQNAPMQTQKPITQDNAKLKDEEIHKYFAQDNELNASIEKSLNNAKQEDLKPKPLQKEINKTTPKQEIKTKKPINPANTNAKLLIIIDDVVAQAQINSLQSIGITLNLSFLPPTTEHPQSATIAKKLASHLIHLPLQAKDGFYKEEENTLKIGDSYEKIDATIAKLKELYPNAKYINNHTGSRFSEDLESSKKLLKAIAKYNFAFIDSKTSAQTKLYQSAKENGVKTFIRDVFLDDSSKKEDIQKELQRAINLAKQKGFAIAIGHPRPTTIEVLKNSKSLLSGVQLIGVNDL